MKHARVVLLAALLCAWGCGKKGDILPPLARVPNPPEILSLTQRGARILLEWVNPSTYADGRPLPGVARVEVWLAEPGGAGEAFENRAALQAAVRGFEFRRFRAGEDRPSGTIVFPFPLETPPREGRRLVFGLRAVDTDRRKSPFSAWREIRVRTIPRPPGGLKAEVAPGGVFLRWEPPPEKIDGSPAAEPAGYLVLRAEGEDSFRTLTAVPIREASYEDRDIEFGRAYRYAVRAAVGAEEPYAESEESAVLEVTPRDTFPPDPPSGLAALPGEDFISLVWDPVTEKDLAGYRVWRREEGEEKFLLLHSELVTETAFIDRAVEKGKRYEYAVSAEDSAGNSSRLSDGVSDSLRAAHS